MQKWEGYSVQKSYTLILVKNYLALSSNANEQVSENLARVILETDLSDNDGYYLKRDNYFLGKLIPGYGWGNDRFISYMHMMIKLQIQLKIWKIKKQGHGK